MKYGAEVWKNQFGHYLYWSQGKWNINADMDSKESFIFARERNSKWSCPEKDNKEWWNTEVSDYESAKDINVKCYGK